MVRYDSKAQIFIILSLFCLTINLTNFDIHSAIVFNFAESAGSASVAFQLLSPGSREYFSQAILQSAAATNPWGMVTKKEGHLRALRLAENSNCPHDSVS